MSELRKVVYVEHIPKSGRLVLVADIGGTNANFGVCHIQNKSITLLVSYHTSSKQIVDFAELVAQVMGTLRSEYGIILKEACFGAAGAVSDHRMRVKPTNLDIIIDLAKIQQKIPFEHMALINDFEAVGWGIPYVDKASLITVNKGEVRTQASQAIIGAGTGLGKAIMGWSEIVQGHVLIPSEGGHADFAPQTDKELAFVAFIKKEVGRCNVSWEDVLSGYGIGRIYKFLGTIKVYPENEVSIEMPHNGYHPDIIFGHARDDKRCHDTFLWYARFYGMCAKNFALESLALSGLYIAGGIAAKNLSLFSEPGFMDEFVNCGKQALLLKGIPITIISDYNVSLYGAAAYLIQKE